MRIAVVYNRDQSHVLQKLGVPNREIIHRRTVQGVVRALRAVGHDVERMEGDKDLVGKLERFLKEADDEVLVFNMAYGIQGQDRYTHIPAVLEMLGVPYVGSTPAAHSFALDKAHTKMVLEAMDVPTPPFAVVLDPEEDLPDLAYPVIAKPKRESMSLGLRLCHGDEELSAAVKELHERFEQPVLVERFIEGREIYVSVLGNGRDMDVFPPVEMVFHEGQTLISREEKEAAHEGRPTERMGIQVAEDLDPEVAQAAKDAARRAFRALECQDLARVDLRIDEDGRPWVLEINSIPGLDEDGPFALGAAAAGIGFQALLAHIVEEARRRYHQRSGTLVPHPALEEPAAAEETR